MSEKLASNRVVKIGIVCKDVDETAAHFEKIFETLPPPAADAAPTSDKPLVEKYREYNGVTPEPIHMKVKNIYLDPIYFELIQPIGDVASPWHDHLKKFGTSVCFFSLYVQGFEQQIDLLGQKGFPLVFKEEKGFERYAYFDTLEKLGITLEIKERIPREK